jgi:dTDP-4-amino-4,6-dideoxygalactose transaminase
MIGNFGDCEVFSFHATKFFNTFEGGAVVTNNDALAEAMRLMRNFGFSGLDNVIYPGTNGKMIEIAAAMGLVNIDAIDAVVEANRRNYHAYRKELADLPGITLLPFDEKERNNYQYVVIEVGADCPVGRDRIIDAMRAENILARKYFWPGCHNMQPYRALYPHAGLLLANTRKVADRVVVLPTGTTVDEDTIRTVASVLRVLVAAGDA